MPAFTQDDIEVVLHVRLSFSVTCGLYGKPVTKANIAELLTNRLASNDCMIEADDIDDIEVVTLQLDDGTTLIPALHEYD